MSFDVSPQLVFWLLLAGLAALTAAAVAVCSGRSEELKPGLDIVLGPQEDFLDSRKPVLDMPDDELREMFTEIANATGLTGHGRRRIAVRRQIPTTADEHFRRLADDVVPGTAIDGEDPK